MTRITRINLALLCVVVSARVSFSERANLNWTWPSSCSRTHYFMAFICLELTKCQTINGTLCSFCFLLNFCRAVPSLHYLTPPWVSTLCSSFYRLLFSIYFNQWTREEGVGVAISGDNREQLEERKKVGRLRRRRRKRSIMKRCYVK